MSSSAVMLVIGFSMIFSWILAMEQFSVKVADFFIGMDVGRVWILLMLDLLILFIGMFLDVSPALLLVTPVFIPVMQALNVDLLHFGAIMIIGLAMGLVTPPLGMCLNAANKICRMPIMNIFWSAAPFLLCN